MGVTRETPPAKLELFLRLLAETGMVSHSAREAEIPLTTLYDLRKRKDEFKKAWDDAVHASISRLEDEVLRRARDGTNKPVFFRGEKCGEITEYSDALAMFLLKGHKPDMYRERHELMGAGGSRLFPDSNDLRAEIAQAMAKVHADEDTEEAEPEDQAEDEDSDS